MCYGLEIQEAEMRFKEGVDYRKLTRKERGGKPWKYELVKDYRLSKVKLGDKYIGIDGYVFYNVHRKELVIYLPYRWNGSNVVPDTKACMRASATHDALCQLINEGKLSRKYRKNADQLYRDMMIEDGAWHWHAGLRYRCLRVWAGWKSLWKGKK